MIFFFEFITSLGSWKVIMALAFAAVVAMMMRRINFRTITAFLIAVIAGEAIVLLLKNLLQFPRPDTANGALMMAKGDYSFPSGHSFMAVVFYGFVAYLLSRSGELSGPQRSHPAEGGMRSEGLRGRNLQSKLSAEESESPIARHIDNKPLRWGLVAMLFLLIFLIGFSRWYLGFHFAGDVVGSWIIGTLWLVSIIRLVIK